MPDSETTRQAILDRLSRVIDPETGVEVVRLVYGHYRTGLV